MPTGPTKSHFEKVFSSTSSRGETWVLRHVDGSQYCVLRNVHDVGTCAGEHCLIHDPSEHHMRDWPLMPRGSLTERLCEHGVGHPDPDSLAFLQAVGSSSHFAVHGCDGCCVQQPQPKRRARYVRPAGLARPF